MQAQLDVSVVIPTCNRPDLLRDCLRALEHARASVDFEVIVSDDSADDVSQRMVAKEFTWVRWVAGPRRGPAANRNTGVAASTRGWIIFTDDDCIPGPGWIPAFEDGRSRFPTCRVFEGRTIADRPRQRIDEESPVNPNGGHLWSCNMAIERAQFAALEGFCESFPHAAMEDSDLRLRLQAAGASIEFLPDAVVVHPYRRTKGIPFAIKSGSAYLHLISRHPHALGPAPWRTLVLNIGRRFYLFGKDAFRYRFRGFFTGTAMTCIAVYFEAVARIRFATRTHPPAASRDP